MVTRERLGGGGVWEIDRAAGLQEPYVGARLCLALGRPYLGLAPSKRGRARGRRASPGILGAAMTIIDAWMQQPTARFLEQPMFASLGRWLKTEGPPEITMEQTLAAMEQANVEKGLTAAWWGPTGPLIDNDEVAAFVRQSGGRLAGVASVDLYRPMAAVRELRRSVRELGFKALRIVPWMWNLPPDDRRFYPLYAECVELNVPFCTQVGHTGPLRPSEPGRPIPYLEHVALEFPELRIVAGHVGFPWTAEMISLATKFPNVYVDTSAYKVKRYPKELVAFLRGHGRRKVLFGSNYPMLTPTSCLEGLDKLGLDDETRTAFLSENARRVFSL